MDFYRCAVKDASRGNSCSFTLTSVVLIFPSGNMVTKLSILKISNNFNYFEKILKNFAFWLYFLVRKAYISYIASATNNTHRRHRNEDQNHRLEL